MVINIQKSQIAVMLKGNQAQQMMTKHTQYWDGNKCLILRHADSDVRLPIVDKMVYLGVVLSYGGFESATTQYRCQQANIGYAQLKAVLRTSSTLSKAQRLRFYTTCVWPSLIYGVCAAGVNASSVRTLQSTAAMHLRKVLRTHERGWSNEAVLKQADLDVLEHLQSRSLRRKWKIPRKLRQGTHRQHHEKRDDQNSGMFAVWAAPTTSLANEGTLAGQSSGSMAGDEILATRWLQAHGPPPEAHEDMTNQQRLGKTATGGCFTAATRTVEPSGNAPNMEIPWTCMLRLRNPHSICYANAVGPKAVERDKDMLLPQMSFYVDGTSTMEPSTPTTGHYRALQWVGASWNTYLFMLTSCEDTKAERTLESAVEEAPLTQFDSGHGHGPGPHRAQGGEFFDGYWPAVKAAMGGEASTAAPPSLAEDEDDEAHDGDRAPKQAKTTDSKGPPGKGRGQQQQGKHRGRDDAQGNGSGSGHGGWGDNDWTSWQEGRSWGGNGNGNGNGGQIKGLKAEIKQLRESVFALQRLTLRHEDFGNCLKAELSWVMFLRLDMKATILPCLYKMQEKWRELKEKHPDQLTAPMRVDLVKAMFKEMGSRLTLLLQQEDQMETLIKLGWMSKEPLEWNYVRWDADHERYPTKKWWRSLAPFSNWRTCFNPSREITQQMGGRNLTMSLQTCIHGTAAASLREHLQALSGLSATQLIGMGLRQDRQGRSALANTIQKQISNDRS
ncbi:unnamed protein product [Symbiodinium sp. CCMP2456]|nr:unnamed protein product [Symbiodinium sp. CCMP2456]